jgi:hypothetical protein
MRLIKKVNIGLESRKGKDIKENVTEEKDNEDIHRGNDKFDEEMNTEVSNDDDNDFNASDDEKNSDETQPTKIKPFNIDEDLSAIMKKNFIGKSDVNCHLFENDQDKKVVDIFGEIFGLHDIYSDSGYKIMDKEA